MGEAIAEVNRDILYQLCQWGVGYDIGSWCVFYFAMPFDFQRANGRLLSMPVVYDHLLTSLPGLHQLPTHGV
jgi:hypothetical protein